MATLQSSAIICSSNSLSSSCRRGIITRAITKIPRLPKKSHLSLPSLSTLSLPTTHIIKQSNSPTNSTNCADSMVIAKLYAITEAIEDRIEMHKNIGDQRNNWNTLFLTSINAITLSASLMAAIASTSSNFGPLKLCSTLMYLSATGLLLIMNKIQPSQLVEEQRNATRLFKNLHCQVQRILSLGNGTVGDVREMSERVLALDKVYPFPLLGEMIEKFPQTVEPAVWWPKQGKRGGKRIGGEEKEMNGWSGILEEEMRGVIWVLERKDKEEYLKLGGKALKFNKILAISGPLLTGLAAFGSAFIGYNSNSTWAVVVGVIGGAMASVVNTIEHGGQVGMVFEMYRNNAGLFRQMGETIRSNLEEREVERRENGELLEFKVALLLGRSLSELKSLGASKDVEEFASKLF